MPSIPLLENAELLSTNNNTDMSVRWYDLQMNLLDMVIALTFIFNFIVFEVM